MHHFRLLLPVGPRQTAHPPPVYTARMPEDRGVELHRISQRVSVALGPLRGGRPLANSTLIAGERITAVIDTMIGPAMLLPVKAAAVELGGGRAVGYVINSHGDPDHLLGNALFPEALVVAHARVAELLKRPEVAERYRKMLSDQAADEDRDEVLAALTLRGPDVTFDKEMTVRLGGMSATVSYVGPAHSVADCIVWVEEERLLVAADIVFNGLFPLVRDDVDNWFAGLEKALELRPAIVVPGHGPVGGPEILERQRDVLAHVLEAVKDRYAAGVAVEDAASEPAPDDLAALPLAHERWPGAVRGIYGVLARAPVS